MLATLVAAVLLAAPAEKPKLVVLDLVAQGAKPEEAAALTEAITQELSQRGLYQVVSSSEVRTMLGVERQKQLLGCSDDAASCTAELAGALGSRFVLSGSLARLGDALQLSVQTIDTHKAQPVGRAIRIAENARALAEQLRWTVAEATGMPLPPPPSRVLPFTLMGTGAALMVAGGALGVVGLTTDAALQNELDGTRALASLDYYQAQAASASLYKTLSLVGAGVGAALLVTGILLNPRETGAAKVALVVSPTGAAVAGVFP